MKEHAKGLFKMATVDWVKDGALADQALKTEKFDLVVLDLGLPKMPGITVLENLRERGDTTPVLILTARDSIEDRVKGLDSGADDYLPKPFDLGELLARLRALQRRFASRAAPLLVHNDISLDPASHTVNIQRRANQFITSRIRFITRIAGKCRSRAFSRHLTQSLYGWGEEVDSNALEVHVHTFVNVLVKILSVPYEELAIP